jgi:hypothetical protein
MPETFQKIEEYIESLEEYFFSSLSAATQDLPNVHEAVNRLWLDISRYGPTMPSLSQVPVVGSLQVPPPPPTPPPPPHLAWISRTSNWAKKHPWTVTGIAVSGILGASLLVGYQRNQRRSHGHLRAKSVSSERRQVVGMSCSFKPAWFHWVIHVTTKLFLVATRPLGYLLFLV